LQALQNSHAIIIDTAVEPRSYWQDTCVQQQSPRTSRERIFPALARKSTDADASQPIRSSFVMEPAASRPAKAPRSADLANLIIPSWPERELQPIAVLQRVPLPYRRARLNRQRILEMADGAKFAPRHMRTLVSSIKRFAARQSASSALSDRLCQCRTNDHCRPLPGTKDLLHCGDGGEGNLQ
jgi:hypothetical protein